MLNDHRSLEVRRLRTFATVAREKSFTSAARKLRVSQPWVSEQIKHIEDVFGMCLIERFKGKFIRLTRQGEEFLQIADRMVAAWDDAARDIGLMQGREKSRLILGVDPVTLYLPERNRLLTSLMTELPGLDLQIVNEQPCTLFEMLGSGRLHMALTLCPAPSGLETLKLYDYELKLFVPKAMAEQIQSKGLVPGTKVMVLRDEYHPTFFNWLREALAPCEIDWATCAETSFHALVQHAAMLGLPTLSPDFSDRIPELSREMQAIPISLPEPVTVSWALMRKPGEHRPAAERLWRIAQRK